MPIAETTVTVRYTNGETDTLPASTPIYVESWQRANSARSDDGSMAHIRDLLPAGTLGRPDSCVGGVDVAEATWYVEDLATGDERICVALDREPTEDDTLNQVFIGLTAKLIAPSCGTRSWDMQSAWHDCQQAAYGMAELGDDRLRSILDRATSPYDYSARDDAGMTLMVHDSLMRSVAQEVCGLMQIEEIRPQN